jgi:hypothetical protein
VAGGLSDSSPVRIFGLRLGARSAILLMGLAAPLAAQTLQGRLLQVPQDTPIPGALVALVDSCGAEVGRAASSASGGFTLSAARPGRYHVSVRQIGWKTWASTAFDLGAGRTAALTFRIDAEPYALPTITVEARRPRCGIRLGGEEVVSRLLDVAQTAIALAEATADQGTVGFSSEWYLVRYSPALEVVDSASVGVGRLSRWPVRSAPADSLRRWGFVRTDGPGQRWTDVGPDRGPVYYGLDAPALFSEWFLASHCFRLEDERRGELRVAFAPERRKGQVDVSGTLVLDRASLELRRIEFVYVHLPRWVPAGRAGGAVHLRRLRTGAWVPFAWWMRAPVPRVAVDRPQPRVDGWVETGGWVRSVRGPGGQVDSAMTREVLGK